MKANIVPYQVHPKADTLVVRLISWTSDGLPIVSWVVGALVSGTPAISDRGTPGHSDFVKGTPETPNCLSDHQFGSYTLSRDEWDAWTSSTSDDTYLTTLIAKALNITLSVR